MINRKIKKELSHVTISRVNLWRVLSCFMRCARKDIAYKRHQIHDKYSPIKITEENNFLIWGVLTYNIKKQLRKGR